MSAILELETPIDRRVVRQGHKNFRVTAIRYAKFSDDPTAVIVSEGNKISYCFYSESLKNVRGVKYVPKNSLLPTRCRTKSFNSDSNRVSRAEQDAGWTSLDDWFEGAPQIEMKEDVVGLGSYGKTLTVLFSDEAIEDDDDNDEG